MPKKSKKQLSTPQSTRPPIVTILGHVDHGKTSLLDAIRLTNVASKEQGGITQHIGAYQIDFKGKKITFIDTPGHAAFVKMRARGASVTDIVVLVIASNEGVMPQTVESINHIKFAKVPFLIALTKIDLPDSNPEKIKKQLVKEGVLVEGYGGDTVVVEVSAKTKQGLDNLLEMILLLSEMSELKGDENKPLEAVVIESKIDKGKGPLASVIVKNGSLKQGEEITAGEIKGKVRAMFNDKGQLIKIATPGMPVEIMGFQKVPEVGTRVSLGSQPLIASVEETPEEGEQVQLGNDKEEKRVKIILKADTKGSLEAINNSLPEGIEILNSSVGGISDSDVLLAKSSQAIIIGFNVNADKEVTKLSEVEKVNIKTYRIIYELLDELKEVLEALNAPEPEEKALGTASVIAVFKSDNGNIAGCKVTSGRLVRGDRVRLDRNKAPLAFTKIKSIKHFKDDVDKATVGMECGIFFDPKLDFEAGDDIISLNP